MDNYSELNSILLHARDAFDATRKIFYFRKAIKNSFSISFLNKKLEIKSRGYLSEVMSGKKRLGLDYLPALSQAFKLDISQTKIFSLLWQLQYPQKNDVAINIKKELESSKKVLNFKNIYWNGAEGQSLLMILEIYSYLDLHKKPITFEQISQELPRYNLGSIKGAVQTLIQQGVAVESEEGVRVTGVSFLLNEELQPQVYAKFIEDSIKQSLENSEKWHANSNLAHFESTIITTSQSKLEKLIPTLSLKLLEFQSELDEENPDVTIKFNVQLFPVFFKKQ